MKTGTAPPILWPLKTGTSENPTLASGQATEWYGNDIPDRAPTGPLALYLTIALLTISGTLTQAGGLGAAISRDVLPGLLIDSIDWTNNWHGTVVSKNYVQGRHLSVIEFLSGGFQFAQRQKDQISGANGIYPFTMTVGIRPANEARGRLVKETSQLALLFQPGKFKLNMQPLSVLQTFSPGATLSGLNARLTVKLVPRQELVLGTAVETVLHQITATGNAVNIKGFGRDTALTGVEQKGGVVDLLEFTGVNEQGGIIDPTLFTDYSFQWRGQGQVQDINAVLLSALEQLPNDRPQLPTTSSGAVNDFNSFPYPFSNVTTDSATLNLNNLLAWIMALGGNDLELTDLQSAERDETYYITQSGGFSGDTHLILGRYARIWQEAKRAAWISEITKGGPNSLAAYVLGDMGAVARAKMRPRWPQAKHVRAVDQETYLPWQFI